MRSALHPEDQRRSGWNAAVPAFGEAGSGYQDPIRMVKPRLPRLLPPPPTQENGGAR